MKAQFLNTDKNIRLAYFEQIAPRSNIGVVIVHGLAEHSGRYTEFMNELYDDGISSFAIDIRGHGHSNGRRGDINSMNDYVSDINAFIDFIKAKYPKMKIALFGHSLGGLITTAVATGDTNADVLILSSPSLSISKSINVLSIFPNWLLKKIYVKKLRSESPEMLKISRNDPMSCTYFTLRLVRESFIRGRKNTIKHLGNIDIPVLLLGGRGDPFVKSGNFEKLLENFGTPDKKLIIYENAKHRIVQNEAREKSIPNIINWLKK